MENLKIGDVLIASSCCGFPDNTTEGKEYVVSKVEVLHKDRSFFWIIADDGKEIMPISTMFKRKPVEVTQ